MNKKLRKLFAFATPVALLLGTVSVNSASYMFFHQPNVPAELLARKKR